MTLRSLLLHSLRPLAACALCAAVCGAAVAESDLPAPPKSAAPPDDGSWPMAQKNFAGTRFSEQTEIGTQNVKDLKVAFTFGLGIKPRGEEAAPVVVDDTMYIVTAWPNKLYALDLTQDGAPLKWTYEPHPKRASQGVACCDVVNRGVAYANGRIYMNTLDGDAIAVDAKTGKEVWRSTLANINLGESITMAPLVAKGKVLVGVSGGEFGVRGWLTALDAGSGKIAWKAYSTGPDADVLIGADFKPFYASERGKDLGVSTWPPDAWKTGGGTTWGWISFDPDLNELYIGIANPGPWNHEQRPGDNKWTAGIFARDIDTGQAKWFYQLTPHDEHDYDGVNEIVLLDMDWNGQPRKVLAHPDRNGYLYVVDRTSGEVLLANAYGPVNTITAWI